MIAVLDANAGIEIALNREKAARFNAVLEKASKVITSDLYKAETTNVLWKYYRAQLLKKEDLFQRLQYCNNLIDEFIDISENNEESLMEGVRMTHSIYDMLYFTLARRYGAILLTIDKKLNEKAKENGIEIVPYDQ
jgi:predicted nucleic acid-binding protein